MIRPIRKFWRDGSWKCGRLAGHVHSWAGRVPIELTNVNAGAGRILRGVQDRPMRDRMQEATRREFALRGSRMPGCLRASGS